MEKRERKVFVKPGPYGSVRDPRTRKMLSAEGEWKPLNSYWARRIRMKDVVVAEESRERPQPKPEEKPAEDKSKKNSSAKDKAAKGEG